MKRHKTKKLEEDFASFTYVVDSLVLGRYKNLAGLLDKELLELTDYLINAKNNLVDLKKQYDYFIPPDKIYNPDYEKTFFTINRLKDLLAKEWRIRGFRGSDGSINGKHLGDFNYLDHFGYLIQEN